MCNLAEYGSYRGKGLMGTAKSGWYSAYTSGAYKKRHPAAFVKRAVKDAINGKRNLPPYEMCIRDSLEVGREVELKGILYDKNTQKPIMIDGKEVTASRCV